MGTGSAWKLIALVVLLILSAFFSASETALMSLSKIRIRNMIDKNIAGAYKIQKMLKNPSKLLSAILVGNNIVNIGASALATSFAIDHYGSKGVGIATGVMTIMVLIFSEITPKSLAAQNSEKVSLMVVRMLSIFVAILNPITIVLIYITNAIIKLLGGRVDVRQPIITEDELRTMINVSHEEGILESEEKKMIHNVFEFGDSKVTDIMTARVEMIAIEVSSSYEKIINLFNEERFSRLPVYKDRIDNIIGVLHIRDLLFFDVNKEVFDITKYMKEPYFTFESRRITQLFSEMRDKRITFAIIIDEYGGTVGMVTMEDLVEEIVGDLPGEYDKQYNEIEVVKENEYIVCGIAKIDFVNETIGIHIESEDFDSIGGFVIGVFGRLPNIGEFIEYNNIKFIVERVDRNRIEKLRILT